MTRKRPLNLTIGRIWRWIGKDELVKEFEEGKMWDVIIVKRVSTLTTEYIRQRLKYALQGLMEDIEAYFDSQIDEEDGDISFCHICDRAVSGRKQHIEYHLKPIKDLIRKWFPKYVK